ncbi:MAG: hypothetical protein K6E38_02600 [Fretibacterium sp.]|nr:hypothetical protein [Fretibacterium sp.]
MTADNGAKERRIYPMTEEIYERGEEVFWKGLQEYRAEKAARRAAGLPELLGFFAPEEMEQK